MAKRLRARPSNTVILVAGSFLVLVLVGIAGLNRPADLPNSVEQPGRGYRTRVRASQA